MYGISGTARPGRDSYNLRSRRSRARAEESKHRLSGDGASETSIVVSDKQNDGTLLTVDCPNRTIME